MMKQKIYLNIKKINGIYGIFLFLYMTAILVLKAQTDQTYLPGIFLSFVPIIVWIVLLKIVPELKEKIYLDQRIEEITKQEKIKKFFLLFLISFVYLLIYFLAFYPGGFSTDSIGQYRQVISGHYSDWHPVLQTLLTFKLPLLMTGKVGSIVLFQILEFSLILAYAGITLLQYCKSKLFVAVSFGYILFSPVTGNILMYPWKDVTFAMTALLCFCFTIHIFFTSGKWLSGLVHPLIFAVAFCVATLSRHNAILFTAPLLLAIVILKGKKWDKTKLLLLCLLIVFLVKGPLYSMLGVTNPGGRHGEILGLPMTIIGNVVKKTPEQMDEETKEFVYAIASQEQWESDYETGSWNSIKWKEVNLEVIEEESVMKILRITAKCINNSKYASLEAVCNLTDMVWAVGGSPSGGLLPVIEENDYGIRQGGSSLLRFLFTTYTVFWYVLFPLPFYSIGLINLIILFFMFGKYTVKTGWRKMILGIPMFVYNFGTMLLLSGDDFRFFYYSFLIFPFLSFLLLVRDRKKDSCMEENSTTKKEHSLEKDSSENRNKRN